MRLIVRIFIFLAGIAGALTVLACVYLYKQETANPCLPEPTTPQLRFGNSDWIVQVREMACGFGISAGIDIIAVNQKTSEVKVLATGDDVTRASLALTSDDTMAISIPNRSDITVHSSDIPNASVQFVYLPSDDPQDRESYKRWYVNRRDPLNRTWFCKNVLADLPEPGRGSVNDAMAYGLGADRDTDKRYRYCPPDSPLP